MYVRINGEELLLHFRMTAPTRRVLSTYIASAYVRLWSVANLLRTHVGYSNGTALVGSTLDQQYVFLPLLCCWQLVLLHLTVAACSQ